MSRIPREVKKKSNLRRSWKSMENLNKVAMEVQENSNGRFRKSQIPRRRSLSESSEDSVNDESSQKEDLEFIASAVEKLSAAFAKIDRYGHGIPSIRPVRELCGKLKIQLNNTHGAFNRTLEDLASARVPGYKAIINSVNEIKVAVNGISQDESQYIPRVEDIKQHLGELDGIVTTVLNLGYKNVRRYQ